MQKAGWMSCFLPTGVMWGLSPSLLWCYDVVAKHRRPFGGAKCLMLAEKQLDLFWSCFGLDKVWILGFTWIWIWLVGVCLRIWDSDWISDCCASFGPIWFCLVCLWWDMVVLLSVARFSLDFSRDIAISCCNLTPFLCSVYLFYIYI